MCYVRLFSQAFTSGSTFEQLIPGHNHSVFTRIALPCWATNVLLAYCTTPRETTLRENSSNACTWVKNNLVVTSYIYVGLTNCHIHIGAGDGAVMSQMAPLFRRIYTTQMPPPMVRRGKVALRQLLGDNSFSLHCFLKNALYKYMCVHVCTIMYMYIKYLE